MSLFSFLEDNFENRLDLNERLIRHPAATFFVRHGREVLIIDRSLTPRDGDTVIAVIDGELRSTTFRRGATAELWGVVTYAIRDTRPAQGGS
jgi:SOS-response transcriptional repressor LexA